MISHFLIWLSAHRAIPLAATAAFTWIFANYWYLRRDIARWKRQRRPRAWSADLATKTGKGGRGASH